MVKDTFALTQRGSVRTANEDSYLLNPSSGIFAVADGLGGLPSGDQASRLTLQLLDKALAAQPGQPLLPLVQSIHQEVTARGLELHPTGFGTTLTAARLLPEQNSIELIHIGDSTAILIRDQRAARLTIEHTVATRMATEQWRDAGEAVPPSAHHTLTQCIGQNETIEPQCLNMDLRSGDRLFLLTDGVTKPLAEPNLDTCLLRPGSMEDLCQSLSFRIESAGSPDNYTMVALAF